MIVSNSKKSRSDFTAICNFIETYEGKVNMYDLMRFIDTFEYYKCFYTNYYIFKDLIEYHDSNLNVVHKEEFENNDSLDDLLSF